MKAARGSLPDETDVAIFFLYNIVEKIFKANSLDSIEISQLYQLFKEDYGRIQFARLLQEQRTRVIYTYIIFFVFFFFHIIFFFCNYYFSN